MKILKPTCSNRKLFFFTENGVTKKKIEIQCTCMYMYQVSPKTGNYSAMELLVYMYMYQLRPKNDHYNKRQVMV